MSDLETIVNSVEMQQVEGQQLVKLINDFFGDVDDALEIVEEWLAEMPPLAEQAGQAFQDNDQMTLKVCVHTVKSAARSVGAMSLGDQSELLQHKAAAGEVTADDEGLITQYQQTMAIVVEDLNKLVEAFKASKA